MTDVLDPPFVTAEEIAEARTHQHERCGTVVSEKFKILFIVIKTKPRRCDQSATKAVLLSCSRHGIRQVAVCDLHLRLLKRRDVTLRCMVCDRVATWIGTD